MSIESIILVSNYSDDGYPSTEIYSAKQKGAGYHKYNDGVHTVSYQFDNFKGSVKIQATLALYPTDNDWIDIVGTAIGGDSTVISLADKTFTFIGRYIWIRAAYTLEQGTITQIRYNY